jgi:hypothetical protein
MKLGKLPIERVVASPRPAFSMQSLRSLRLKVTVALVLAAAACAHVTSQNSNDELQGAYRDSAREVLLGATASFDQGKIVPLGSMRRGA